MDSVALPVAQYLCEWFPFQHIKTNDMADKNLKNNASSSTSSDSNAGHHTGAGKNDKAEHLSGNVENSDGKTLTTSTGLPLSHTDDSLKAGRRGPTIMEDFHFREKMTHFDHERIPERVVHARGSAAHGYFQVYEPLTDLTKARI